MDVAVRIKFVGLECPVWDISVVGGAGLFLLDILESLLVVSGEQIVFLKHVFDETLLDLDKNI